ncbi:MAG: CBS domain-containing protein [Oceanospirillaceae bacterium]|nr:CBS domain-containing protein [Oceanospirillaceae bacterium]
MLKSVQAKDYMSEKFLKISTQTDLFEAIDMLLEYRLSAAPVVDMEGHVVGVISEGDCLKAILTLTYHEEEKGGKVGDYMTRDVSPVNIDTDIIAVSKIIIEQDLYCLPITQNGKLVGQISRSDVLRAVESFSLQG